MKQSAIQLNWILDKIKATGYLHFDNIRNFYSDKRLSQAHLETAQRTISKLVDDGWIKKKRDVYIFTKLGLPSWKIARQNKEFIKLAIEKGVVFLIPDWNVHAKRQPKPKKEKHYRGSGT